MDRKEIALILILGLLVYSVFKPTETAKLEGLIIENNIKIDNFKTIIYEYEKERKETKKSIDSINFVTGPLPEL